MADRFEEREFNTRAVWSGTRNIEGSVTTPAFLASTYQLTDERYREWEQTGGHHTLLYSRYSSVNSEAVSEKIASLEGAEDGETIGSGMAAISSTLFSLLSQGDHVVTTADIYGGTYGLMTSELPRYGIEVTLAAIRDPASFEAAIKENTKVLYVETITNPTLKVCDLEAMSAIAEKHGLTSVVDNTFAHRTHRPHSGIRSRELRAEQGGLPLQDALRRIRRPSHVLPPRAWHEDTARQDAHTHCKRLRAS